MLEECLTILCQTLILYGQDRDGSLEEPTLGTGRSKGLAHFILRLRLDGHCARVWLIRE